jgi:hypothetical protein
MVYWWQVADVPRLHRFTDDRSLIFHDYNGLLMTGRCFSTITPVYWWQVAGFPRLHRFTDDRWLVFHDYTSLLMTGRWFSTINPVYWWQVAGFPRLHRFTDDRSLVFHDYIGLNMITKKVTYAWRARILVLIIIQSKTKTHVINRMFYHYLNVINKISNDKLYQLLALVGGSLRVLRLLPPLQLFAMI